VPGALDVPNHLHSEPLAENRERGKGKRNLAILIAILLVAAAVRFYDIDRHPLWLDEFFALQHSAGQGAGRLGLADSGVRAPPPDLLGRRERLSYPHVWRGMADADVHPPLYQLFLRAWRDMLNPIFGDGDVTIRALTALLSVAAVAAFYDVVRLMHGVTAARWAALIMALATPQIHWAQDARPYALLSLLALGAIDAVVRFERLGPGKWRAVALGLCTLGVGLTHYYGLPALLALGCYAAIRLRGPARVQAGVAMLAGVTMFAVLWGPSLLHQLRGAEDQSGYLLDESPGHLGRTLLRVALLPARSLNEPSPRIAAIACLGAVAYALPVLLLRRRPDLLPWAFWMAGALAPAVVLDLFKRWEQLDYLRYTSLAMPAFYAIVSTVLDFDPAQRTAWLRHVLPATAALSCAVSLPRAYAETETPKPDYPYLARTLVQHANADEDVIVFYYPPHDRGSPLLWYMALSWYAGDVMPRTAVFLTGPPGEPERTAIRAAKVLWTVSQGADAPPADVTAGREPGPAKASGFGMPAVQQWVWPSATTPTAPPTTTPTTQPD